MSSLTCKRCGKPVSDAYSKSLYCKDCGKSKARIENINIMFRAFGLFTITPILVAVILSIIQINSALTLFSILIYFTILTSIAVVGTFYTRKLIRQFDSSMSKMQPS